MKKILFILPFLLLSGCSSDFKSLREESLNVKADPVSANQIEIQSNLVTPSKILISDGDTVTFINKDSKPHRLMSDPHPTHDQLPDLDSGILYPNETYQYRFTQSGNFGIHVEDNPSLTITAIVR